MTTTERALAPITITRAEPPTPEAELEAFERENGIVFDDQMRHRFLVAQPYKGGDLAALHEAGEIVMMPEGERVLMRAILTEDASVIALAAQLGQAVEIDARRCVAHEIIGIGPGVEKYLDDKGVPMDLRDDDVSVGVRGARPRVGDHCFVLSTVADRASKTSRSVRLWTVHVADLSLRWLPKR